MFVSQNNNRLILAIVVGIFLATGCSGHSVKYGANSEGEGLATEEEMTGAVEHAPFETDDIVDGRTEFGGNVDSNASISKSDTGVLDPPDSEEKNPEMAMADDATSASGEPNVSDYGRQFEGVDGVGPNHDAVTGFGSGSAEVVQADPEAWANA